MIKFKCSSCGFERDIADQYAGKKVLCPKCNASNLVANQQSSLDMPELEKLPSNRNDKDEIIRLITQRGSQESLLGKWSVAVTIGIMIIYIIIVGLFYDWLQKIILKMFWW